MLRRFLVAVAFAAVLATPQAWAQQTQSPPAQGEVALVGLPVYSSDGQKLGEVTQVGTAHGQRAVQAEIGGFLGIGSSPVVIVGNAFQEKGDRIELLMTADEVRDSVAKQKQEKQEKQ